MLTMRSHSVLAPIRTGYELDDVFSVVVPIARTNEILNPSGETNLTGWNAGAGTLTRSTEQQYHGAYSFKYVPSAAAFDGFFYEYSVTPGVRAISCKFRGQASVPYQLLFATSGAVTLTSYDFIATGRWQWRYFFWNETATATRRIYFRKNNSTSIAPYYVDGVQSEVCASGEVFPTTYIDGDQQGLVPNQFPAAYLWNGTPHASTSSRSGLTRAGGRVMRFKDFGWFLTAIIGLGLAAPENVATEYARLDGGFDDYTRKPSRQFTLMGRFEGADYLQLRENRGLAALFDRDLIGQDQRMTLLHHLEDACGNVLSDESRVLCKYQGGLGGNTNNQYVEETPITFTQYLPYVLSDGEAGASLAVQQSVTNANGILQRTPAGLWQALGTGMGSADDVTAIALGPDGKLYVGGHFTSMGGVANTSRIAYWENGAWHAMGTGCNGGVNAIAIGPDGSVYVAGGFTLAGGVANTDGIAKWNGSVWAALGTGVSSGTNNVIAVIVGPDGSVYAGGEFSGMGGVANTNGIAKWNGSAWVALAGGNLAGVWALAFGLDGNLYAAGTFVTADGVSASRIAKFNGTAWSAVGSNPTINGTIATLAVDAGGNLYAGGFFTTIGGATFNYIGKFNGTSWVTLGSGLNDVVNTIAVAPDGTLYVGGRFTSDGVVTFPDSWARWNGSAWVFTDTDFPGAARIFALHIAKDGTLTVGYDQTGTATTAALTSVSNGGTGKAYSTLIIKGPSSGTSRIYIATNYTNGRTIYLNYTINSGETAYLRFEPDNLSFISDFQGNIANKIRPGSNEADFFLQPGVNSFSFFAAAASVTAALLWRPSYVSLDDVP